MYGSEVVLMTHDREERIPEEYFYTFRYECENCGQIKITHNRILELNGQFCKRCWERGKLSLVMETKEWHGGK